MKFQLKNIIAVVAIALTFTACSDDDNRTENSSAVGTLKLEFDNIYGEADLAFDTPYTNSNNEVIKINELKYIVSNIVLTKTDGTTHTVPKSESYFFINEADEASTVITLSNVPVAVYNKISFGIGVDEAQFTQGAEGQGNLWETAESLDMTWSWTAGYKFIKFEGTYTSASHTDANFMVHTGKTGDIYNYAAVSLNLPDNALVQTTITPQIHIMANAKAFIDGTTVIRFEEGGMVMGGTKVQNIMTDNVPEAFEVHHVHND